MEKKEGILSKIFDKLGGKILYDALQNILDTFSKKLSEESKNLGKNLLDVLMAFGLFFTSIMLISVAASMLFMEYLGLSLSVVMLIMGLVLMLMFFIFRQIKME